MLCKQRLSRRLPQRPESSQLPQENRRDADGVSGGAAAEHLSQQPCDGSGAGLASGAEHLHAESRDRAGPAGCARAEPWPRIAQPSVPCEPQYSPMLYRARAQRQREADTALDSELGPLPSAATELNVTESLRSFDFNAATQPQLRPDSQTPARSACPDQPQRVLPPPGVPPSRAHLFRGHESPPLNNQQQQNHSAALPDSALKAAQAAARRALAAGLKAATEPPCMRCLGVGHSRETCRFSDKTARKRREKAKLAAKAARQAAQAAAPTPSAVSTADGIPPPEHQHGVKRKHKPKGVAQHGFTPS